MKVQETNAYDVRRQLVGTGEEQLPRRVRQPDPELVETELRFGSVGGESDAPQEVLLDLHKGLARRRSQGQNHTPGHVVDEVAPAREDQVDDL